MENSKIRKKGIVAFGMACMMALDCFFVPSLSLTAKAQENKASLKSIVLDTSVLKPSGGKWSQVWNTSSQSADPENHDPKIYYGKFNGQPLAFRVLDETSGKLLLDCDIVLENCVFDTRRVETSNIYYGSTIQKYLEGEGFYTDLSVLSNVEKQAIATVTLPAFSGYSSIDGCFMPDMQSENNVQGMDRSLMADYEAPNQHVFLLSAQEVDKYYNITYDGTEAVKGVSDSVTNFYNGMGKWYTRTALKGMGTQVLEMRTGHNLLYRTKASEKNNNGYSPALYVKQSSILFASDVKKNKKTSVASVGASTTTNWKLTLKDSGKKISLQSGKSVTKNGSTVTVPYSYTGSGVNQISVMITDKAYTSSGANVLYYGALSTSLQSNGTGTFTLPSGLPSGYKMYILAEKVNGLKDTDYASEPYEISLNAQPSYQVTGGADKVVKADADVKITANGPLNKFKGLYIDSAVVDSASYELADGPTVVTIKKAYIKKLKNAKHSVEIRYSDGSATTSLTVKRSVKTIGLNKTSYSMYAGKTYTLTATVSPSNAANKNVTWKSSDTTIAKVDSNGKVTAVKKGTVTITCKAADGNGAKATCTITVKKPVPEKDKIYTVDNIKYKVVDAKRDGSGCVTVVGMDKKSKETVTIPKTVSILGYAYKITKIGSGAFKGCDNVKTVTIETTDLKEIGSEGFYGCSNMTKVVINSKALTKIGKKAFYNCKNLKTVTLKTTKLTADTVGDSAFKGIKSTCHFNVPDDKIKAYKKLFTQKGASTSIIVD